MACEVSESCLPGLKAQHRLYRSALQIPSVGWSALRREDRCTRDYQARGLCRSRFSSHSVSQTRLLRPNRSQGHILVDAMILPFACLARIAHVSNKSSGGFKAMKLIGRYFSGQMSRLPGIIVMRITRIGVIVGNLGLSTRAKEQFGGRDANQPADNRFPASPPNSNVKHIPPIPPK